MKQTFAALIGLACAALFQICGMGHQRAHAAPAESTSAVPVAMLPRVAVPLHYRLMFTVDPKKHSFRGHEELDVKLGEPQHAIFIHGRVFIIIRPPPRSTLFPYTTLF